MNHSLPPTSTFYHYDRMFSTNPSISSSQGSSESATYYNEIQMDDGKWTREQTQVLIDTWKTHKYTLLSTASSSAEHFKVWKLIANEVNKLSPPKSLQQCKKKFRNIRYICKTAMNNNKQSGTKKHYPMFYSDFVEIISESERNKEGIRGDMPSVEILRDGSMDDSSIDIEEHSPRQETQDLTNISNMRTDESNLNKTKPKNLLRTKNVSSFNSTDSFHDSPRSHDGELQTHYSSTERRSASPSINVEDRTENDENTEDKPITESRSDEYCTDENLLYVPSDILARKHKHIDVSIMGRGYPPPKRIKRSADGFPSPGQYKSTGSHDSATGLPTDTYPTMAPITYSQESFTVGSGLNYASAALTSAARKYKTSADLQPSFSRDSNYSYSRQHNGKPNPIISVGSRDSGVFQSGLHSRDSFNERFLEVQERQMELFSDMLNRHEQFLLRLLSQQREAAEEAQRRDREFMLKLIEMFVKHT